MANLHSLFLKISNNLLKEEVRNLRNYVCGAGIVDAGFAQDANAHEIFQQMQREKKLTPGNLLLLADILREIGRHDFADQAEEFAANEGEASKLKSKSVDGSGSCAKEEPASPTKRPRLAQSSRHSTKTTTTTAATDSTKANASSSSGLQQTDDEDDDDEGDEPIDVLVEPCTKEMWETIMRESEDTYGMSKKPRGFAFILSITKFSQPDLSERKGGDVDVVYMKKLMEGLSLRPVIVEEKTAQEIKDELRRFTQREEHWSAECSVVVLMSHGIEDHIYGTDGQLVALEDIFAMFDENTCLLLKRKPKLFFIQACRGKKVYRGPSASPEDEPDNSSVNTKLDLRGELRRLLYRTSKGQDEGDAPQDEGDDPRPHMFCGYATQHGYMSFRNTANGSWFIQAITSVFMKNAKDTSLDGMKTMVEENLRSREANCKNSKYKGGKVEADFLSTLKKDLYFFPGM